MFKPILGKIYSVINIYGWWFVIDNDYYDGCQDLSMDASDNRWTFYITDLNHC